MLHNKHEKIKETKHNTDLQVFREEKSNREITLAKKCDPMRESLE
jgi:hypothetical protein